MGDIRAGVGGGPGGKDSMTHTFVKANLQSFSSDPEGRNKGGKRGECGRSAREGSEGGDGGLMEVD